MKNITIIVPIHKYEEDFLQNALNSIKGLTDENYRIIYVGQKSDCEKAEKLHKKIGVKPSYTIVENERTDFASQINKAVMACVTQYFTILEYDDEYTETYFKAAQRQLESDSTISMLLPIIECYNSDKEFIGLTNEIALDATYSDENEIGVINFSGLEVFYDYNCTGSIIKTEDFIVSGGLKASMKVAMWYEFLLRLCNNFKRIYVMPKIGYRHIVGRKEGFQDMYKNTLSIEEVEFLRKTANEEYFFKEDRKREYQAETANNEEQIQK